MAGDAMPKCSMGRVDRGPDLPSSLIPVVVESPATTQSLLIL